MKENRARGKMHSETRLSRFAITLIMHCKLHTVHHKYTTLKDIPCQTKHKCFFTLVAKMSIMYMFHIKKLKNREEESKSTKNSKLVRDCFDRFTTTSTPYY